MSFSWRRMRPGLAAAVMTGEEAYSVHNGTDTEAQLRIFSTRLADPPFEKQDDFWT